MQTADSATMLFFHKKNANLLNQEDLIVIGDDELDKLKNSEIALDHRRVVRKSRALRFAIFFRPFSGSDLTMRKNLIIAGQHAENKVWY